MKHASVLSSVILASMTGASDGFTAIAVTPSLESRLVTLFESNKQYENHVKKDIYHKGGNSRYQAPVVEPARLSDEAHEDCDEPFIDHATGDELCWGETPSHPRNNIVDKNSVANSINKGTRKYVEPEVAKDYHKGGNALYQATNGPPRKLEDDHECETPFIDFVSGDELCWNDADYSP